MLKQIPGIIYIESQRGKVAENEGETHCLFHYKSFADEHKKPLLPLQYFNETVLQAGGKMLLNTADSFSFILPIYNMLEVFFAGRLMELYPGEAICLENDAEMLCINPQEKECASFIWFIFNNDQVNISGNSSYQKIKLPVNHLKNQWIDLPAGRLNIKIACLGARSELKYNMDPARYSKLFFYNIAGSFEVCGRLLNQNDGLVLWDCDEVDMEALSEDSIILLLEL